MLLFAAIICEILACAEVDMFIPSFPELQRVFNLSPFMVQLTVSINFISYCLMTLFVGPLSDRFGRKKLMVYGLWSFLVGSIFCVFAPNFPLLLFGRFFQGLGMAAPATLAYVVIADHYSKESQVKMLGILNGVVSGSMAFAPVVGSFVNLYLGWRANFVALLALGVISLFMCTMFIPNDDRNNKEVSLSLRAYAPLFASKLFISYIVGMCLLIVSYWTFIGMAPILYMEDLGVHLKEFGFYQGAVAGSFCFLSFMSPMLMNKFGQIKCFKVGSWVILALALCIGATAIFVKDNPLLITCLMCAFGMTCVIPINVLWPASLEVVPDTKARASSILNVGRLLFTGISLEGISYIYTGSFFHTGIFIALGCICSVFFFSRTPEWNKIDNAQTKKMAA